jgi:predicted nucleotidyltransferase
MQGDSSTSVWIFYQKFDREELIQNPKEKLRDLAREFPLSLVVLFGSYAHRNYTIASDIDVLIVYKGEEKENPYAMVKKTLDIQLLEPHVSARVFRERIRGA